MLVLAYEVDKVENMENKRFSKKKKYIGSWGQKDEIGKGIRKLAQISRLTTLSASLGDKIHTVTICRNANDYVVTSLF